MIIFALLLTSCDKPIMSIEQKEPVYENGLNKMTYAVGQLQSTDALMVDNAFGMQTDFIFSYKVDDSINEKNIYLMTVNKNGEWEKMILLDDVDITKACSFVIGSDVELQTTWLGMLDEDVKGTSGPYKWELDKTFEWEKTESIILYAGQTGTIKKNMCIPLAAYWDREAVTYSDLEKKLGTKSKLDSTNSNENPIIMYDFDINDIYENPKELKKMGADPVIIAIEFS